MLTNHGSLLGQGSQYLRILLPEDKDIQNQRNLDSHYKVSYILSVFDLFTPKQGSICTFQHIVVW